MASDLMLSTPLIPALCAAILLVLVGRAIYVLRAEKSKPFRGANPGTGHHTIHAEYSSGLSGHHSTYKIPRDPDAYARMFVPKRKKDKT